MDDIHDTLPLPRTPLTFDHEDGDTMEEAAIDNLLEQYGGEQRAVIKFYRVKRGEPDALLEEIHPADFNFLHLAKKYGRDTYRIRLFAPDISRGGRLVQRMNRTEAYAGEVDPPAQLGAVPAAGGTDAIERLTLVMAQGFQELGKMIVTTQQNHPKPPDMTEMLNNMVLMRQAMGLDARPAADVGMDKMLGLLQQGIELGKDLAGSGGDGESSFMKVAEKALPSIAEIVGKAMDRQPTAPSVHVPMRPVIAPPRPGMAPNPAPAPALPPNAAPEFAPASQSAAQPQQVENPEMFGMNRYTPFKPYVAQLADTFQRNPETDPYAYAVLLLDNLDDVQLEFLLSDDKLLDNLAEIEPRVREQRTLWESLLATVRELTGPEEAGSVDPHVPEQAPTHPAQPGPAVNDKAA